MYLPSAIKHEEVGSPQNESDRKQVDGLVGRRWKWYTDWRRRWWLADHIGAGKNQILLPPPKESVMTGYKGRFWTTT